METIRVHDKTFAPYLSANDIQEKVDAIAHSLERDYADKNPIFIAILNGSFIFAADLFRKLKIPAEICFIRLASYKGTNSTGNVISSIGLDMDIYQRHVIILEDIIDTGRTLSQFLPKLEHQQPASLKIAALLHKPLATIFPIEIHYLGFTVPDKFVVGYGLDYDGHGRNNPAIFQLVET
jgi:hypoxanthine phosphoribosyltransferase